MSSLIESIEPHSFPSISITANCSLIESSFSMPILSDMKSIMLLALDFAVFIDVCKKRCLIGIAIFTN